MKIEHTICGVLTSYQHSAHRPIAVLSVSACSRSLLLDCESLVDASSTVARGYRGRGFASGVVRGWIRTIIGVEALP